MCSSHPLRSLFSPFLAVALLTTFLPTPPTSAQSGAITYRWVGSLDVEVSGPMADVRSLMDAALDATFVLHFSPWQSLMQRIDAETGVDSPVRVQGLTNGNVDELARILAAWAANEPVNLQAVYTEEGGSAAVKVLRSGDPESPWLVEAPAPAIEWEITGERAEHAGHIVTRAVAREGDDELEAWFAPEIPLPFGPALYGGLPGMILVVSFNEGQAAYAATEVTLGEIDEDAIRRPELGEPLSPEEYRDARDDQLGGIGDTLRGMIRNYRDVDCRFGRERGRLQFQCLQARGAS